MHSADWDEAFDYQGKEIAVIGSGSSAIQIVPSLQKVVKRLQSFVRGKTWIATPFAADSLAGRNPTGANHAFTEEERKRFREDPEYYRHFRRDLETELNGVHGGTIMDSEMQQHAVELFKENMRQKLTKKPEIFNSILPDFPVACRRLTPGPGYLEALTEKNVDFITTGIRRIIPEGIECVDDKVYKVDAIVCATGFDTTGKPRFPFVGQGGVVLSDKWEKYPAAYMSHSVDQFPNMFMQVTLS